MNDKSKFNNRASGSQKSWKETFLSLYMSFDHEKYKKSLELKRKNFPKKLYRYRPLTTKKHLKRVCDEIKTGTIYFSHRKDFNDPFDSAALLQGTKPNFYNNDDYEDSLMKTCKGLLSDFLTFEEIQEAFSKDDWYEKTLHIVTQIIIQKHGTNKGTELMIKSDLNSMFMELLEDTASETLTKLNSLRIACFTERFNNLPMWAHYANNHTGICLEYDIEAILNTHTIDHILRYLYPVYYVETLPDIIKDTLKQKDLLKNLRESWAVSLVLHYPSIHKLIEWQYEKEWRLIMNIGFWRERLKIDDVFNYENGVAMIFTKPSKVFLGYNISESNKDVIINVAQNSNVPIAKMEATYYGLTILE